VVHDGNAATREIAGRFFAYVSRLQRFLPRQNDVKIFEAISRSKTWRIVRGAALVVLLVAAGGAAALVASRLPKKNADQSNEANHEKKGDRFRRPDRDTLLGTAELVNRIGIKTALATIPDKPVTLPPFLGCLALDNDLLTRIHSRFAGEVVSVSPIDDPGAVPSRRPLRVGDVVHENQLLAVVWCKDLGEKKSELVDALSHLRTDEDTLRRLEALYKENGTSERSLREQERNVEADRIAAERAERTLRSWRLTDKEIDEIRDEADRIRQRKSSKTPPGDWAKVEVRAWQSGEILEKNITIGDIVDTTMDLFKIGNLSRLAVWAHVYEEDLALLKDIGKLAPLSISLPSRHGVEFRGELEQIGAVIDPNQHTALVKGHVDNASGELKIGQFVTVTVQLKPREGEVVVPTDALVEDGQESVVFVQPNENEPRFVRRSVRVVRRFHDTVYLKQGSGVSPKDRVVTSGALLLHDAMDDLPIENKSN
jgi:membrane fusion protein, heavy metal efflux system